MTRAEEPSASSALYELRAVSLEQSRALSLKTSEALPHSPSWDPGNGSSSDIFPTF